MLGKAVFVREAIFVVCIAYLFYLLFDVVVLVVVVVVFFVFILFAALVVCLCACFDGRYYCGLRRREKEILEQRRKKAKAREAKRLAQLGKTTLVNPFVCN